MKSPAVADSSPFQLDATNERLLYRTAKGTKPLRLRPKTFAVLSYLLERNQKLVTKEQFLDALWPGTWVTDSALKSCIRELRSVLGDDPRAPRFIETVHRRGYRFIGQVGSREATTDDPRPTTENWHPAAPLVGRDSELARLRSLFGEALTGERRIVFVTGEAGIGKTALADTFLLQIRAHVILWLGQGQCVEHYGRGEP